MEREVERIKYRDIGERGERGLRVLSGGMEWNTTREGWGQM